MNIIEKILAKASGQARVRAGDVVVCDVHRAVLLDLPFIDEPLPVRLHDPDRVAVIFDHGAPAPNIRDATGQKRGREFVRRAGIRKFYDMGRNGICHQVILEEGLAVPGQVLACMDSHTCASGALNCAARGLGRLEMLQIICTGKTWFKVCPTVKYVLKGAKKPGVYGKDVFLYLAGKYGDAANENQEFGGPGLAALGMDDRATIATMAAEVSAEFSTFPADRVTFDYLQGRVDVAWQPVDPDADAEYLDVREIDLDRMEPYVSKPDFVPGNTCPVGDLGRVPVQQAFIGSCANGKLEDIRTAAAILEGRQVHPDVRLIVTPASQRVYLDAVEQGYVATLVKAGATVTNSTCGACFGHHMGVLAPGEACITSSTRNFKGRMGSPDSTVYIGSSATVAASALAGHIADPRQYLS